MPESTDPPQSEPATPQDDVNALEGSAPQDSEDALENAEQDAATSGTATDATGNAATPEPKKKGGLRSLARQFNIYLLFFVFILVIAGVIIGIAYFQSKKAATTSTIQTQKLTDSTLQQVASGDATVGSAQGILNIQSSAVFAGKVLVRQGLEVAGNLQIGGTVALNNVTVSGTSQLGQVQVNKDIAVAGNSAVQGSSTIAKTLQVNGGGTFGGTISAPQVTTTNLELSGDLVLTHHFTVGGSTPNRTNGSAVGNGGSSSVSGSDTAGSVSINVGGSPAAGCFTTINFSAKYNVTPHVLITPIGSSAGGLSYYVTRTSTNFSICVATPAPAGSSFGFDYFVVG